MPDLAFEIGFITLIQPCWLCLVPNWKCFGGSGWHLGISMMQVQFLNSSSSSGINSQRGCWGSAGLSPASLASSLFPSPNRWWVITWSWFIIQIIVVLLQSKHFCWLSTNAKTISQPPLILGFNCFALLSTDVPLPHAWSPPPLSPFPGMGFFLFPHC